MYTIILGAGISGLGAGYSLAQNGNNPIILKKDETYGGLCGNFAIEGFRSDRFVHFSFTKDEKVNRIFVDSSPEIYCHKPNPFSFYNGLWIKRSAQNNLFLLPEEEKEKIIADFRGRPKVDSLVIENYERWFRIQHDDYFVEHFFMVYTRKYWMTEACDLEIRWIGSRLYQPSLDEVIQGAQTADILVTYYPKEMCYPVKGGYKQYLVVLAMEQDIHYNEEVIKILPQNKSLHTASGTEHAYN